LADNAAIKAGLLAGDTVLKINDTSTAGYSVDRAVKLIRGDEGTTVKLTILRGSETKDYTVTRATINNPSVYSTVVDDVGIITITRFDAETGVLAKTAAQGLIKQGAKSVILDLRDNGGGYVDAAVDVASLWLENKVIVTERVGNTVKETLKSGNSAILKNLPTIVLVNGSSASASEIVSGALQDYKVAKLVGTKTFGKGSVQELINLDDGSTLKVTVARWYTPNGRNINKDGINPDSIVEMTEANLNAGIDTQMDKAKDLLKQ
jgi:carboxyl-terminal processing protease